MVHFSGRVAKRRDFALSAGVAKMRATCVQLCSGLRGLCRISKLLFYPKAKGDNPVETQAFLDPECVKLLNT